MKNSKIFTPGLPIGNLSQLRRALEEVNEGNDEFAANVASVFNAALNTEAYLLSFKVPEFSWISAQLVFRTAGNPNGHEAVIGNRILLRRTLETWTVRSISRTLRYPGQGEELDLVLRGVQNEIMSKALAAESRGAA